MSKASKKRSREASSVNADLVAIYEDLASEDNQIRINAALRLLSLDNNKEELVKILKRLLRGLCSSRKAARLGFSVALTEFLARHVIAESHFTVEQVLAELKEQTAPAPGAAGQELRDYYFGRLFALEALIKSKILLQPGQEQSWLALTNLVLELYYKKQWLREECGWVLQQALVTIRDQPTFLPLVRSILELLRNQKFLQSLEGIALRVAFRPEDSTVLPSSGAGLSDSDPLSLSERSHLLNALQATVTSDSDDQTSHSTGTTWSSKLHYAWITIFEAAWKAESADQAGPGSSEQSRPNFTTLWTTFVEEHLFANTASEQRKYWGFLMVQHFTVAFKNPSFLLKPNFLRCFCNQLSEPQRHLHGIAAKTLKTILNAAQKDKDQQFAGDLLIQLVGRNGRVDFDKITKTKSLEKLITLATPQQREACLMALNDCMKDPDRSSHFHVACADLIVTMVRNHSGSRYSYGRAEDLKEPVITTAISMLIHYGFLEVYTRKGKPYTIPEGSRSLIRARLLSVISHSITQSHDPSIHATYAANMLLRVDYSQQPSPMCKFDQDTIRKIKHAGKTMAKCSGNIELDSNLEAGTDKNLKVYQAFRLLFALSIIQAFAVDADALNILEELEMGYTMNLKGDNDGTRGSGGIADVILSLTSRQSVLFRRVGKEVFSSCTAMLDQTDLDAMFDVLQKRENLAGQQELFDVENSEESPDEGSDDQAESIDQDSDVEMLATPEEDPDEVIEFENKLAQALGTHRGEDDLKNSSSEDSDEEMMDDEQMAALDPLMSNIFKQQRKTSQKKDNKKAKENVVQFKTKVLELLEIYVQEEAKNPQNTILATIPDQCIACMQTTKDKHVAEKAGNVVKTALNVYKLSTISTLQKQISKTAKQELRAVQARILQPAPAAQLRACSQASLLLAKIMLNNGSSIKQVWKEYNRTGKKMAADPDAKVFGVLFSDWFNWLTTAKLTLSKRATEG